MLAYRWIFGNAGIVPAGMTELAQPKAEKLEIVVKNQDNEEVR